MRIITVFFIVLTFVINVQAQNVQHQSSYILKNVNIIDVENKTILPAKSLLINKGKIEQIIDTPSPQNYPDHDVIDGQNGYVTPGLIDMHVHMYERAAYLMTLSHGITHVRIMNGVPKQLEWRDNVNAGTMIGSSSTVSSPIISAAEGAILQHGINSADEARKAIRKYHAMGYDLIKAYGGLDEKVISALIEEGQKIGMPIAKHGPHIAGKVNPAQLSTFQSLEHAEDIYQGPLNYEFDSEKLPEIIAALKAANVPITPTLNIFHQLTKLSQDKEKHLEKTHEHYTSDLIALEASKNQIKRWIEASDEMVTHNLKTMDFLKYITQELHKQNIPLLVGSDSGVLLSPHGIATHNEMSLLLQSGLTPYDVLKTATINAAKTLKMDERIGKIEDGFNADLIYTIQNPIQNINVLKNPEAVMKNGNWYSRETLETMREEAIANRSLWEEIRVLFNAL
ncbi:amidohydrolase family protein [Pseudemcibacter aquimaris]|uniref:amidohydrolase family protein n=1 Tax=Pseudemcibacter aquimaris TaxID=2857064 RepID=UPI002013847A|nr:amidohydrolase family protein [Pseudemcibacter aquimaris]MCC3862433.1 amidohydrolase family protein [Pseudemcibacter aquimaris]WDU59138.1 amidohydrolase family protein [Pseudemcibacter aquimaris]